MNIEVGMMVEIIFSHYDKYVGHAGKVIGEYEPHSEGNGETRYEVDGADPHLRAFPAEYLRPIPDQQESFVEKYSESWSQPIEVEA